jgi:HlyD family secretion protein
MNRSYFKWLVLLALLCTLIVPLFMWNEERIRSAPPSKPLVPRPVSPYPFYISAVGVVEASTGNILIGSPVNRVVDKIEVKVGQKVKEGEVLFRLESHDLTADLASRCIDYENAKAQFKKLEALPRPEDIAAATAQLNAARVTFEQAKSQWSRVEGLDQSGAMSREEVSRRRYAYEEARARYQQVEADFNKIEAGTWAPDLEIAKLQVNQAKALVDRLKTDIDRTIIKAPTDATVLQIKIHEGEFPPADPIRTPAMIIGNTDKMHLRVSINQFDASYFNPNSPAVAYLQGNPEFTFPLKFEHIEPYFVPKQHLTNEITEVVDTRVLQVIYSFEESKNRVFVGQQMDVYIETLFNPVK